MNLLRRPQNLRKIGHFEKAYPSFDKGSVLHSLPESSLTREVDLRPNTLLLRPYSPAGFTEGGLYVSLNEKWARIWGFVLAISQPNKHNLNPGDLILFERWYDLLVDADDPVEEKFKGEKQPICHLHEDSVIAIIRNNRLPVPM